MTIRTRITAVLAATVAALVAPFKALREVVLYEPNTVKRRAALLVTLVFLLPIILIVGAWKTLGYTYRDIVDNLDFVFGDLPGDIRDRWHGRGVRRDPIKRLIAPTLHG